MTRKEVSLKKLCIILAVLLVVSAVFCARVPLTILPLLPVTFTTRFRLLKFCPGMSRNGSPMVASAAGVTLRPVCVSAAPEL